eukprot:5083539-Prymnesium_polylepis.1
MPPPPGEDAVLHREARAAGADLGAPSPPVWSTHPTMWEREARLPPNSARVPGCRLVRAYRVLLLLQVLPKTLCEAQGVVSSGLANDRTSSALND